MLDDRVFRAPALVQAGIERPVHREDIGREVQHERIRALGHEIDGEAVDGPRLAEGLEQGLEVGALLQPVEGPHHVLGA